MKMIFHNITKLITLLSAGDLNIPVVFTLQRSVIGNFFCSFEKGDLNLGFSKYLASYN